MDKQLWNRPFHKDACPPWPCPVCNSGVLILMPEALREHATIESMRGHNEDWWGPENVVLSFTAWAECSNKKCAEEFAISGTGFVDQVPIGDDMQQSEYVDFFTPRHVQPALHLCTLPTNCPDEVRLALEAAFGLYWQSKPATAGRIRVALERLLDHLGIPSKNSTGKTIALGIRIDQFSKSDPINGAYLMALKWLGNVGSHTTEVDTNDLLDAFEVFEHVLAELIGHRSAAVANLAAQLTVKYKK